jgi:hypothetical protein
MAEVADGIPPLLAIILSQLIKHGDRILVKLDGPEPEVREFTGFGPRHLLIATSYLGYNYDRFFVDASDPKKPHTKYHRTPLIDPDFAE